jgi:pyruvate carboxylase
MRSQQQRHSASPPAARPFTKLLAANRSEIAIRIFRAATGLGLRTVAIYAQEDRFSIHRFKADEAYLVWQGKGPVAAYLDIEGIVPLAKATGVEAIHPGYGLLSENAAFARACARAGITFVGPRPELLEMMGDKTAARALAHRLKVPTLKGTEEPVANREEVLKIAREIGFPLLIKAAFGGGGRGMRVVSKAADFTRLLDEAQAEAGRAFGNPAVFLEKYIPRAKHIEVQILGDQHGNVIHLHERDCSVQRHHQKEWFFLEMNSRIHVEHTVTEVITGLDLVRAQILIAQGYELHSREVGMPPQDQVRRNGYAIQCRLTTEDPENKFMPDYGKILAYRSSGGVGIRLDGGMGYVGAVITPVCDPLLVIVIAFAHGCDLARHRMDRATKRLNYLGNVIVNGNPHTKGYRPTKAFDLAVASMSGSTSQPNLNSIVVALQHTPRDTRLDLLALNELSDYWEKVREYYTPFDAAPKTGSAEVYLHGMPGGQYTNLREQAASMGVTREAYIADKSLAAKVKVRPKANLTDPRQIPAPIPGLVATIAVTVGHRVSKGDKLLMMEAMKMQTTVSAPMDGVVEDILVNIGDTVESKDLLLKLRT